MFSLVAYEDSESEDDFLDQMKEGGPAAGSCEQNQEVRVRNSSEVIPSHHSSTPDPYKTVLKYHGSDLEGKSFSQQPHSQPLSCFDWQRKCCSDGMVQEKHLQDTTSLSLGSTRGKSSQEQTLPHMPQSFSDKLKPAKRPCTFPPVVRPYIPKRQRLATTVETVDSKFAVEQVPGNQTKESLILSEVSERVKPYLAQKPGAAGIPRRLLLSLEGHQGPVNTVQWCSVPHLSHLLLSASMDKTFKV